MTLMELGALGEFVGAIAVVVTLGYLAIQIRQNTRAMQESRRLALAQTYPMRADALQEMLVRAAESERIAPIITKLTDIGYPEDIGSLDEEYYRNSFCVRVRRLAPIWNALGVTGSRHSFEDEMNRLAAEDRLGDGGAGTES